MCEVSAIVDHEQVLAARHASDHVLGRYLHVPIAKAMNLGTPRGFDRAVAELATALRARTSASEAEAVRSAVEVLDVDWRATTAEERRNLIAEAMQRAERITSAVPRLVEAVFGPAADEVVDATRTAARRGQRLNIAADFNALDRRIVEHLRTSQTTYVRDAYGRRNAAFGARARTLVADGLERGLARDDITADLQAAAEGILIGRGQFYWEVVAGAFIGQGRSFAQLSAYTEAGIERYIIEAVLDERTTEICRFLHGKSFTVGGGLRTFERIEAQPESVPRSIAPWVREAVDPDTGRKVLFVDRGGQRTAVAEVIRSGFGTRDDRGEFGRALGEQQLLDLGISFPPYHGLCRTTTVADISAVLR